MGFESADNCNIIISHIRKNGSDWEKQSNFEHQQGVARLAAQFASEFGMGEWGRVLGLFHDKGKEQQGFQQYIKKMSGYQPEIKAVKTPHAYVGAILAKRQFPKAFPLLSNAIAGHHRGLYDFGDLKNQLAQDLPSDVSTGAIDGTLSIPQKSIQIRTDFHHLQRMLFSCLVDADRLDTEAFMTPEQARLREGKTSLEQLYEKLLTHLSGLNVSSADTVVNKVRRFVQQQCVEKSCGKVDFYSLTVPTGGGKTLASVLWALGHAIKNGLHRIIIAIPYTSIIVQTAATLKNIFGEENVLEHHSNVDNEEIVDDELAKKYQLATENWDYPIVVTTNVQLFESLFSNEPSACRKLHNIVKSVLILDEVQTLPLQFLRPIVDTFKTLNRVFDTSVLFTTASQPTLEGIIRGINPMTAFEALPNIHEIIPESAALHQKLRRVKLDINDLPQSYDEVVAALIQLPRVLCIVNTRRDAREIYNRLPKDEGICLHLSRMMCPEHVRQTIQLLKEALQDKRNTVIRVVATQLIEAGVDIDFPVVYRQEAGLDSILQAAGRCNREGLNKLGVTHVFSLQKEHTLPRGFITQTNNARLNMVGQFDWFSPDAMREYYRQLYSKIESFDETVFDKVKYSMHELLYKQDAEFEQAAKCFRLIDDKTTAVVVNWQSGMGFVEKLVKEGATYHLLKMLSQYSVNVRQNDMKLLLQSGAVEEVREGIFVVSNPAFYDAKVGLIVDNQWLEETYIL